MRGWSFMRMRSRTEHNTGPELRAHQAVGPRLVQSAADDVDVEFGFFGSRFRIRGAPPEVERWLRGCWESSQHTRPQSSDWLVDIAFGTRSPWNLRPPH